MKKKISSIVDIARELNVSITTISFILNGKAREKRISNELVEKVLKYVEEVNYVPNQLAKSLRTGKTNIVGLIVEDISNVFFATVARLIEEYADKRGYKIFYCSSENDQNKTRQLLKVFRERQISGYIITPSEGIEEDIRSLLNDKCRVILFDRYLPGVTSNYVVVDNLGATSHAIEHLIEQGYQHIALVTLDSRQTQMQDRLKGYEQALKKHGRKPYIKKLPFHENTEKTIDDIMSLLRSEKQIDAIFFATNYLAVSGLEAIKRLGLEVPSDIGIIAFDDHDLFRLYTPSITVVAQPIEEMSEKLINILLDQLEETGEVINYQQVVLPAKLVIRNSTTKHKQPARATKSNVKLRK
jgi:LacI family transcriptional regulator